METSKTDSQIDTAARMARTVIAGARGKVAGKSSHRAVEAAPKVRSLNEGGGDRLRDHVADEIATRAASAFQDIECRARHGAEEVVTLGGLVELFIFLAVTRAYEGIRLLVTGGARGGVRSVHRGSLPSGGPNLA